MDNLDKKTQDTGFNNQRNLIAALGYVWILSIVILLLKKGDPFITQHAKNGAALFVISWIWFIPFLGWIVGVTVFLFEVYGFVMAFTGKPWKLPLIGDWLENLKI
jgi:uncharacterized membrane protein